MQIIRCAFVDFWEGFLPEKYIQFLFELYQVVIDGENPDYVFYSCFGQEHHKYDSRIKIFWCGENLEPDFNECDYAITYSEIAYAERTLRHCYSPGEDTFSLPKLSADQLLNRKFCNFIYTNNQDADPFRLQIFQELCKYKKVDAGGGLCNNIGYRVPPGWSEKIKFQHRYKFSLAIENSRMPGYTTEKLFQPFRAQSLPVYWGNPRVEVDYNPESFVNLGNFSSVEQMVDEIIRLDNDDDAYLEKAMAPFWPHGARFEDFYRYEKERFRCFYDQIFNIPTEQAYRRPRYGRSAACPRNERTVSHPARSIICRIGSKIKRIYKLES